MLAFLDRDTYKSPSIFGELLTHDLELAVGRQEDLDVWNLIDDGCHTTTLWPQPESPSILCRGVQRYESGRRNVELFYHVIPRKLPLLVANRFRGREQAVKPSNP